MATTYIIRAAIAPEKCQAALQQLGDSRVIKSMESHDELEMVALCQSIGHQLVNSCSDRAQQEKSGCIVDGLVIGRYRASAQKTLYLTDENAVFATVALEQLQEGNGLIQFPTVYPDVEADPSSWQYDPLTLQAGDIVLWRGGRPFICPTGGGGFFMTLIFR